MIVGRRPAVRNKHWPAIIDESSPRELLSYPDPYRFGTWGQMSGNAFIGEQLWTGVNQIGFIDIYNYAYLQSNTPLQD
jgi:hypothetical protein